MRTPFDIDCAVVIAAGSGQRLRASSNDDAVIKPLTPLLGIPLLVRVLRTLRAEGVAEAMVVTGYRAPELRDALAGQPALAGLALHFVHNPDWQRQNGLSVLAAADAVGDRPFFLSMADHVYAGAVLRVLKLAPPASGELALAVDLRVDEVSDPDDAMWVRLDRKGRIRAIGKELLERDAVDTGVFAATPALFEALEAERDARGGDCALADGVRRLAEAGLAYAVDIGEAWWQDVDTLANLRLAERKIEAELAGAGSAGRPRLGLPRHRERPGGHPEGPER